MKQNDTLFITVIFFVGMLIGAGFGGFSDCSSNIDRICKRLYTNTQNYLTCKNTLPPDAIYAKIKPVDK